MTCNFCGIAAKTVIWSNELNSLACRACKDRVQGLDSEQSAAVFADDIPGGLVCENYGPQPITFYSHSERRAYMQAHGLREKETFCPMPGTDKDPQGIPNPEGYVDDQTMRNRQSLFLRAHNKGHAEEFDSIKAGVIRNLTSSDGHTHAEAIRAAKGE